ncbi:MAG: hypothetical protein HRU50_01590 [Winogradskyella sp.]|uniref:hypothetical protein n=1 Tax=Winogradskyella sp. TaxID=1883156 RepID=UPI0025F78F07|nr:hypothetical protein [Winogradskyella sp.]NRB58616.1 hypothetical protein [Winogradskyella sp.]
MKKYLEKQAVFNSTLRVFAFFSKRSFFNGLTQFLTTRSAKLNLVLNKPKPVSQLNELAQSWQAMMPPDGQEYFKIKDTSEDTAYTEIHLHCPLRGTGNVEACYKLMNYDRQLMNAVGGQLIVLESQSNSGKNYCRLAIREKQKDASDLVPAHKK